MSQTNFRVLKEYIKKGLVDILDRDVGYRRGCSAHSEDEDKLSVHLRKGQRPSDM